MQFSNSRARFIRPLKWRTVWVIVVDILAIVRAIHNQIWELAFELMTERTPAKDLGRAVERDSPMPQMIAQTLYLDRASFDSTATPLRTWQYVMRSSEVEDLFPISGPPEENIVI